MTEPFTEVELRLLLVAVTIPTCWNPRLRDETALLVKERLEWMQQLSLFAEGDVTLDRGTPDDSVTCELCGKETSLAMIAVHLEREHDIDPEDIENAPIVDFTDPRDET